MMKIMMTYAGYVIMIIQHAQTAIWVIIYLMENVIPVPLDVVNVINPGIVIIVTVDIIILIFIVIHVKAHVIHVRAQHIVTHV